MALTLNQLKHYANQFLMDNYGLKLTVPLELNGRLKTTKGRFVWYTKTRRAKSVQLNKFFVENNESEVVKDVLKHELVHFALFVKGIPHADGDYAFEKELRRLGVVSQSTIDKYNITTKISQNIYKCIGCKREYKTKKKLKYNGMYHRCHCGEQIRHVGKVKKVVTV